MTRVVTYNGDEPRPFSNEDWEPNESRVFDQSYVEARTSAGTSPDDYAEKFASINFPHFTVTNPAKDGGPGKAVKLDADKAAAIAADHLSAPIFIPTPPETASAEPDNTKTGV